MKPLFLFILLIFAVIACDKKDEITQPEQFPEWLKSKITELTAEHNICTITDVTIIEYKGKKYYNIYCGYWSCVYCQLFDENGTHPTWNTEEMNNFFANKKDLTTLPACE